MKTKTITLKELVSVTKKEIKRVRQTKEGFIVEFE